MDKKERTRFIGDVLIFLAGLAMIIWSVYQSAANIQLIWKGEKVTGVVAEYNTKRIDKNRTIYTAVFRYTDKNGVERSFSSAGASYKYRKIGKKVTILYNPNNPQKVKVFSFGGMFLLPIGLSLVGLLCMVLAIGLDNIKKRFPSH